MRHGYALCGPLVKAFARHFWLSLAELFMPTGPCVPTAYYITGRTPEQGINGGRARGTQKTQAQTQVPQAEPKDRCCARARCASRVFSSLRCDFHVDAAHSNKLVVHDVHKSKLDFHHYNAFDDLHNVYQSHFDQQQVDDQHQHYQQHDDQQQHYQQQHDDQQHADKRIRGLRVLHSAQPRKVRGLAGVVHAAIHGSQRNLRL